MSILYLLNRSGRYSVEIGVISTLIFIALVDFPDYLHWLFVAIVLSTLCVAVTLIVSLISSYATYKLAMMPPEGNKDDNRTKLQHRRR